VQRRSLIDFRHLRRWLTMGITFKVHHEPTSLYTVNPMKDIS
jgi:hypothetical protein